MTKNIQVISIPVYNQITTVHKPVKQINKFKIIHDKKSPARLNLGLSYHKELSFSPRVALNN